MYRCTSIHCGAFNLKFSASLGTRTCSGSRRCTPQAARQGLLADPCRRETQEHSTYYPPLPAHQMLSLFFSFSLSPSLKAITPYSFCSPFICLQDKQSLFTYLLFLFFILFFPTSKKTIYFNRQDAIHSVCSRFPGSGLLDLCSDCRL